MAYYPFYPELDAWLAQHHAIRIGQGPVGDQHHDLYIVNQRLLIVALYNDNGLDIFIPASSQIRADFPDDPAGWLTAALKAAELACGINSRKG